VKFIVYKIINPNDPETNIYIGRTKDIIKRQKQHQSALNALINNKDSKSIKDIHRFLYTIGVVKVELIPITSYKTITEAKRMEMLLILLDHFGEKKLIQKVPNISDR